MELLTNRSADALTSLELEFGQNDQGAVAISIATAPWSFPTGVRRRARTCLDSYRTVTDAIREFS